MNDYKHTLEKFVEQVETSYNFSWFFYRYKYLQENDFKVRLF
jgi:hypothetical protein